MFKTSILREVRKEKYERSDVFEEPGSPEPTGPSSSHGWESLQELNGRFARYINRARVLEQRNAVFRKQLETLQRMEEATGLEEAFSEQISLNRQRVRELCGDRAKLERELKDAERMLDEFTNRYKNECEYQEQLRRTLEQLNKEADSALLRNLEYQIQSQFLQDDINSTKDRHRTNLAEIQTYVNILHQINQMTPLLPSVSVGISEEQERLIAQRRVPALQSQLEEYKSALCQLQAQKQRLQSEMSALEQAIKSTQESFDSETQMYNEQIESLRKDIEEAERSLEKCTGECRQLAVYQTSLENELDRYKRIIENEDNRLNSAIIGTPITLFTTNYKYIHNPPVSRGGKDITQAMQDITNVKPRQKNLSRKVIKKKEITTKDVIDSGLEERTASGDNTQEEKPGLEEKEEAKQEQCGSVQTGVAREDVPDGAQISKAFDTLCNIVRDRMRKYKRPEPLPDFYTKGRYVLVSGDSSYPDPCFYTSTPSGGHIFVTIRDDMMPPYEPYRHTTPSPPPSPSPVPAPVPPTPSTSTTSEDGDSQEDREKGDDSGKGKERHPKSRNGDHHHIGPDPHSPSNPRGPPPMPSPLTNIPPDSMSYEKVEVVESVERRSPDNKVKGYEETAMVVETMIEKTTKKKRGNSPS
ncbi:filensin [Denticeps clupeoides]|uniref:Filensin n=1 Tax=Denticeps clupeoides TaxID=299321 RepID=A0AAY4DG31_9TELE|nr:filensin [Denticeps clupeoides]